MKLLLDTHVFLWFIAGDARLSFSARSEIEAQDNLKLVSIASLWEMAIKISLGKLTLDQRFDDFVPRLIETNGFDLLAVRTDHVARLTSLPFHHRDPFDRLLLAQARAEGMTLVSDDGQFGPYGVPLLW